jgi:serine/threonine-protein kinase
VGDTREGKILKGRFEIVKTIEDTAEHILYLAKDKQSSGKFLRVREIKTKMKGTGKNTRLEMAQKEAQILQSLDHPGIPKYIDFFPGVDCHYLITEYIEGDYLDALLKSRSSPFPYEEVAPWAQQICEILKYLHTREKPIIVRAVQPSNLLLTFKGEIKLTNFGMARQFDEVKSIDTVFVWNPGFTSPEQYGKQKSDNRSDIYSMGATLYNLLTNQDVGAMNFNFPPIRQFNSTVPSQIEEAIMKCLAVNPDDRYQTIYEVHSALLTTVQDSSQKAPVKSAAPKDGGQKSGGFFAKLFSFFKK